MKILIFTLASLMILMGLSACYETRSPIKQVSTETKPGPRPPSFYAEKTLTPITSKLSFDQIGERITGFQISPEAGSNKPPVLAYIFFDPLCIHCAKQAAQLMMPDAAEIAGNIVWVPVGFLQPYSTLQAATILSSPSPDMTFLKHETLVAVGQSKEYAINVKLATQPNIDKVVENTKVWLETGAERVPFIVTRSQKSKKTLSTYGVLEGFEMAEFLSEAKT